MSFMNIVTLAICMGTLTTCVSLTRRVPWRTGFLYTMVGLMPLTQIMFLVKEKMGWTFILPSFLSDLGEMAVSVLFLLSVFIIRVDAARRNNSEARLRLTEAMLPSDAGPVEKKLETDIRLSRLSRALRRCTTPRAVD